jgi:hypothetical protein
MIELSVNGHECHRQVAGGARTNALYICRRCGVRILIPTCPGERSTEVTEIEPVYRTLRRVRRLLPDPDRRGGSRGS